MMYNEYVFFSFSRGSYVPRRTKNFPLPCPVQVRSGSRVSVHNRSCPRRTKPYLQRCQERAAPWIRWGHGHGGTFIAGWFCSIHLWMIWMIWGQPYFRKPPDSHKRGWKRSCSPVSFFPLLIGFQPFFRWCRISQPSTVLINLPILVPGSLGATMLGMSA